MVTSGMDRMFCAGANIQMLPRRRTPGRSTSASSPTRPATASRTPRRTRARRCIAAVNGTAAGGGYELALACDEIVLVDDRSSAVSLPEVPLLGVLPGTGGLTRVVDKRGVRRDLADVFSTSAEGIRGGRAVQWRLVDGDRQGRATSPTRSPAAPPRRPRRRPARRRRPGVRLDPARARRRRRHDQLRARRVVARPRRRHRHHHRARPGRRARRASRSCTSRATGAWLLRHDPRARRRDPAAAHQRADHRHLAAPHRG